MKTLISVFTLALMFATVHAQPADNSKDEKQIRKLIEQVVVAGDKQDSDKMSAYLHDDFRVVLNRAFGSEKATLINKTSYCDMLAQKKIGGDKRELSIGHLEIREHIATVEATLTGQKAVFYSYYHLVKNENDKWVVISDMPLMKML